jgi:hypothetical protein
MPIEGTSDAPAQIGTTPVIDAHAMRAEAVHTRD